MHWPYELIAPLAGAFSRAGRGPHLQGRSIMADVTPNISGPASGIVQRAKDILLKPKETWPVSAAEPATTQSIYVPYVVVLAAIGPIAQFVGGQVFGFTAFGVTYHPPICTALGSAVLSYDRQSPRLNSRH